MIGKGGKLRPERLTILEILWLVCGAAIGIWVFRGFEGDTPFGGAMLVLIAFLGGFSLVGPPLLLSELRRRGRWGAGKVAWFTQGMASWLLWPPVVYARIQGKDASGSAATICYLYGTPLMAIYMTSALLAGGWLRRRGKYKRRAWREQFGLLLAMAWSCTGVYVLYLIYGEEF